VAKTWTCQRSAGGVACKKVNPARKRLCEACGKARPARKRPAHMAARDLPYEFYVEINGGSEACGICGRPRSPERKHHRHHEHKGEGFPLGLLCHVCNRVIGHRLMMASGGDVLGWLRKAVEFYERAEARR
jgi:hypothetical protein